MNSDKINYSTRIYSLKIFTHFTTLASFAFYLHPNILQLSIDMISISQQDFILWRPIIQMYLSKSSAMISNLILFFAFTKNLLKNISLSFLIK